MKTLSSRNDSQSPLQVVVLVSGRGSNLQALVRSINSGVVNAVITGVISNNASAPALKFAKSAGIPTTVVERRKNPNFEQQLIDAVLTFNAELVVLAGFMAIVGANFIRTFENRVINIHPSLLPSFRGLDAQEQALEAGVKIAGCTVHVVVDEVDAGQILAQAAVPVLEDDTAETLAERILAEEHKLLPAVVHAISVGSIQLGKLQRESGAKKSQNLKHALTGESLQSIAFSNDVKK